MKERREVELSVGDVMTKGVIYSGPKDNIQRVAEIMKKNDIDSIIVIEGGKGKGIVTDSDIIKKVVAEGKDTRATEVSEIMSSPLITITPDNSIEAAARLMRDKNVRRLVAVSNNRIVGIISEFDIVKVEPAMHLLIREHSQWDIADMPGQVTTISGVCESCSNYSESLSPLDGRLLCEDCISEE